MSSPRPAVATAAATIVLLALGSHAGAALLDPVLRASGPAGVRETVAAPVPLDPSTPPPNLARPAVYGFHHAGVRGGSGYYRYHDYRPPFRPYLPRSLRRLPYYGRTMSSRHGY